MLFRSGDHQLCLVFENHTQKHDGHLFRHRLGKQQTGLSNQTNEIRHRNGLHSGVQRSNQRARDSDLFDLNQTVVQRTEKHGVSSHARRRGQFDRPQRWTQLHIVKRAQEVLWQKCTSSGQLPQPLPKVFPGGLFAITQYSDAINSTAEPYH